MLFQTLLREDEANKIIKDFTAKQLEPALSKLEKLALNVSRFRIDLFSSFNRRGLHHLQEQYQEENRNLLGLYYLYGNPTKLFADLKLDPQKDAEKIKSLMDEYYYSRQAIMASFDQAFKLLELSDRQLSRFYQSADQRLAMFLSSAAITVSALAVIFNVF